MNLLRRPAATIRLRLTAVYGLLFLACGTALLAITYLLVRRQYTGKFFIDSGRVVVGAPLAGETSRRVHAIYAAGRSPAGSPVVLSVGAAHAQSVAALHQLLVDSGIALAIMAVLSIWLGWLIAGRALRPLRVITNTARTISATSLHRRLGLGGPDDELKELGTTFDDLLQRLDGAFEAQRRFVANASHELRTPLTLQRALLELALSDPAADSATLREACEKVLVVGQEQERLIEALLTLSRSERGLDVQELVDVAAVAEAAVASSDWGDLNLETSFRPAQTAGDPRLIERLTANLIDNAVKYNHVDGRVVVRTETRGGRAILHVVNTGDPVEPADIERLLEPFERLERHRAERDGFGLGLSIVHAVAQAHGALLTAVPQAAGGLDISIEFPARPQQDAYCPDSHQSAAQLIAGTPV